MNKYKTDELNPVHHFFHKDSAVFTIIGDTRYGFLNDKKIKFSSRLLERAENEAQPKREALDASMFPFAYEQAKEVLRARKIRTIMLVEGRFTGDRSVNTIIPRDLGTNPYPLFENLIGTTIDSYVSEKETVEFLRENKDYLLGEGYTHFVIETSRFFYLREKDLKGFYDKEGKLDMKKLVPCITPARYIVLDEVKKPTLEEYLELAPRFTSSRLKQSIAGKLEKKLCSDEFIGEVDDKKSGQKEQNVITDWAGYRIVAETKKEMDEWFKFFKNNPKIGKSQVEFIYEKDYYEKEEVEGGKFKAKIIIARVNTAGYEPRFVEIQFMDKEEYHNNEYGEGRGAHWDLEKKRKHLPRSKRKLCEYYRPILEQIFGKQELVIDIRKLK